MVKSRPPEPFVIWMTCPDCRSPGYYDNDHHWRHAPKGSQGRKAAADTCPREGR
jgi:hypothetical protein